MDHVIYQVLGKQNNGDKFCMFLEQEKRLGVCGGNQSEISLVIALEKQAYFLSNSVTIYKIHAIIIQNLA